MHGHRVSKTLSLGFGVLVVALAVFLVQAGNAQVTKGKTRAALTKHLMAGINKVHSGELKKLLDAGAPDAKAWASIELSAALLNEASYILMEDGRCPDGVWSDAASKTLRGASADVLKAAAAKDLEAAKKAAGEIGKACGACHKAHKKS
jgi:cytochrome c556